jgi:Mrp family chromosome partitioning ATPase
MPNISVVQKPSPAMRSISDRKKILIGLASGGVLFGLALVLLLELGVDRTVRRPVELEGMRIPRMLTIPDLTRNGYARLHAPRRDGSSPAALVTTAPRKKAPWDEGHFIRPFCESLRDRLILHFHLINMTRKPKLVAVTGCSTGAGTSTLAGGLAAALSETGEGKVLLVDMNVGHEEIHPFFEGKHSASLAEAIQSGSQIAATSDNLYLAKASPESSGPMQLIPKKFYDLVPRLKTCDFDYIIFDMPPLGQTSTTLAMAGFMDKVLLVVEAEASNRDTVKRDYAELTAARANVSAIFNKSRSYGPKWLHDEV